MPTPDIIKAIEEATQVMQQLAAEANATDWNSAPGWAWWRLQDKRSELIRQLTARTAA
jgi:hypothetical protein